MKHEKGKSEFEILVSKPSTFQTVGRYSKALALIESLKLSREVSSIRSRQALDWQIYITEHEGPLYAAVLEGCMFAKTAASFELSSINMSLETLGKIMRERKPQTFEEVAIWSAIYCDLAHREEMPKGYEIGRIIEKYAQWLWRVNMHFREISGVGIPYNYIDDSVLVADNIRFICFTET